MLTLGFEASAKSASAALVRDGELVAQYFQHSGLTHSRTLLPMAEDMLRNTETELSQVDRIAVSYGPGSFTGIRIGVATVKGLCWGSEKPAVGVSTLEAMAWNGVAFGQGALICGAMDARRGQIYNALFEIDGEKPVRLCRDRAISLQELAEDIKNCGKTIFVVGDGACLCYNHLKICGLDAALAPEPIRTQSAWGVCMAAQDKPAADAAGLLPVYLRLSQAERERQARMNEGEKDI